MTLSEKIFNGLTFMLLIALLAVGCKKDDNTGPVTGTVKDIDGNIYNTIKIGTQIWMSENLKTTRFKDGTSILLADSEGVWSNSLNDSLPLYCWMENNKTTYEDQYGALYNGFAVLTGKLCPDGWHVSMDTEWETLEKYAGMPQAEAVKTGMRGTDEGGKLKETGGAHWRSPNIGATNAYGFNARPGGQRNNGGYFTKVQEKRMVAGGHPPVTLLRICGTGSLKTTKARSANTGLPGVMATRCGALRINRDSLGARSVSVSHYYSISSGSSVNVIQYR
jgi:uncharacterized protein (TIGR02145 family)